MSMYYLDISSGDDLSRDIGGIDCQSIVDLFTRTAQLTAPLCLRLIENPRHKDASIEIRNENNEVVFRISMEVLGGIYDSNSPSQQ